MAFVAAHLTKACTRIPSQYHSFGLMETVKLMGSLCKFPTGFPSRRSSTEMKFSTSLLLLGRSALSALTIWSLLLLSTIHSSDGFAVREAKRFGGRQPSQPDKFDPASQTWEPDPLEDGECRLIICQITDVYTL